MKTVRNILGGLLVLTGGIWILQGIQILPGSFMTGQAQWAVYGAVAVIVGMLVLIWTNRG